MKRPAAISDASSTSEFDFLSGCFNMSDWHTPYFTINMTLQEAADSLMLVSEYPGVESLEWDLEELYQRDVNWKRVERKIYPYLENKDKPQFFNSLTVVLLPKNGNTIEESYSDSVDWKAPEFTSAYAKTQKVGPINFAYFENWDNVKDTGSRAGRIKWNKRNTFSVALDGQHRLAAIKKYVEQNQQSSKLDETRIPVILLIFDERLGYKRNYDYSLTQIMRNMFIDLNKTAVTVTRTRNIILDDNDPFSVCVRGMVSEKLGNGYETFSYTPPKIPLNLVDWHSDLAKFEDGPYVTTILGLEWIVRRLLGVKPITDFMNYKEVASQIKALQRSLKIDLSDSLTRLEDAESIDLRPFYYRKDEKIDEIATICENFLSKIGSRIVDVFTNLTPYKEFIDLRKKLGSDTVEFITWFYYRKRADEEVGYTGNATKEFENFTHKLRSREENPVTLNKLENILKELNTFKTDNLAFKVVFQRAIFDALSIHMNLRSHKLENLIEEEELPHPDVLLSGPTDSEEEPSQTELFDYSQQRTAELVDSLNQLYSINSNIFDYRYSYNDEAYGDKHFYFWQGTLLNLELTIDFTQAASSRTKELLLIILYIYIICKSDTAFLDVTGEYDKLVEYLEEDGENEIHQQLMWMIRKYNNGDSLSTVVRILRRQDEEYDSELAKIETISRIRHIAQLFSA